MRSWVSGQQAFSVFCLFCHPRGARVPRKIEEFCERCRATAMQNEALANLKRVIVSYARFKYYP